MAHGGGMTCEECLHRGLRRLDAVNLIKPLDFTFDATPERSCRGNDGNVVEQHDAARMDVAEKQRLPRIMAIRFRTRKIHFLIRENITAERRIALQMLDVKDRKRGMQQIAQDTKLPPIEICFFRLVKHAQRQFVLDDRMIVEKEKIPKRLKVAREHSVIFRVAFLHAHRTEIEQHGTLKIQMIYRAPKKSLNLIEQLADDSINGLGGQIEERIFLPLSQFIINAIFRILQRADEIAIRIV